MKELTIEQKAKVYDEALERAKVIIRNYESRNLTNVLFYAKEYLSFIFPELKESEDEKMKREILELVSIAGNGNQFEEIKDWLEKQGGQKESSCDRCKREQPSHSCQDITALGRCYLEHEKQGEQKPTDKVEPKFRVGDWGIDEEDGTIFQIVKVLNNTYTYRTNEGNEYSCTHYSLENDARHWTIQDVREGDVLVSGDVIFIFNKIHGEWVNCHCSLFKDKSFMSEDYDLMQIRKYGKETYPATKEQRDLLFQKMKEAEYEWDANEKKLKKIEQEYHCNGVREPKEATGVLKQLLNKENYAWSEEDKVKINRTVAFLENLNLKNLNIIDDNNTFKKDVDWLKSLRPQNTWKPTERMLEALKCAKCEFHPDCPETMEQLKYLYQELKQLYYDRT